MEKVQLGKLTLYNGDNMGLLKSLPDNAFELAIVDPPYGDAATDKIGGGIGTGLEGGLISTRRVNHAWGGGFRGINTKRRNMVLKVFRRRRRLPLTSLNQHT